MFSYKDIVYGDDYCVGGGCRLVQLEWFVGDVDVGDCCGVVVVYIGYCWFGVVVGRKFVFDFGYCQLFGLDGGYGDFVGVYVYGFFCFGVYYFYCGDLVG